MPKRRRARGDLTGLLDVRHDAACITPGAAAVLSRHRGGQLGPGPVGDAVRQGKPSAASSRAALWNKQVARENARSSRPRRQPSVSAVRYAQRFPMNLTSATPFLCRRERARSLSHRGLRAEPRPMRPRQLPQVAFVQHWTFARTSGLLARTKCLVPVGENWDAKKFCRPGSKTKSTDRPDRLPLCRSERIRCAGSLARRLQFARCHPPVHLKSYFELAQLSLYQFALFFLGGIVQLFFEAGFFSGQPLVERMGTGALSMHGSILCWSSGRTALSLSNRRP